MMFYILITIHFSNILIHFTNIKAKKDHLGGVVERVYKILFVKVGNVRIVALT